MRIATFNVENLFVRPRIMNLPDWEDGKPILEAFAALTDLLERPAYSPADKTQILHLLDKLGLLKADENRFVRLRRNRGALLRRPETGPVEVVANGRADWIGWIELVDEQVNATAIRNTAQVVRDLQADILCLVEAEHRPALRQFNEDMLVPAGAPAFDGYMLIDGNDRRGIDVAVMTAPGYEIGLMRSHVNERRNGRPVFSRDCPEYQVTTPAGETIWVLPCHLKSKGYGKPADNDRKRLGEAQAIAGYVDRLLAEGATNIVVMGDLNDTPDRAPLAPLFQHPALRPAHEHPAYQVLPADRPGTHGLGTKSKHIDHILLSQPLWNRITAAGVFRKGAWPGVRPRLWDTYPEVDTQIHAASDHHAVWVELG